MRGADDPPLRTGLPLALIALMFAQGLQLVPGEQLAFFKRRSFLMLRSLAAVLVLVPLSGLAIILVLKPSPAVGVGLAILARLASRFGFSTIPLYLLAGLAFGGVAPSKAC